MVALHLANVENALAFVVAGGAAVGAAGALTMLALIGRALLTIVERADAEVSLLTGQQICVGSYAEV